MGTFNTQVFEFGGFLHSCNCGRSWKYTTKYKAVPFWDFFLPWLIQLLVCNVFNGSSRVGKISKVVVNMENTAHQRWAQVLCRGLDERSLEERFEVLVTELMDASGLGETLVTS